MCERYVCRRDHSFSLIGLPDSCMSVYLLCGKQRSIPTAKEKTFKANWALSDARLLVKNTRLGFRLSMAVRPPYKDLPLTRYPAASPDSPALPITRYPAASQTTASDSHNFSSFKYILVAIGRRFFNALRPPHKHGFQQSTTVKVTSSQGPIKQDFSFTPSESILVNSLRQIQVTGPIEDKDVTTSIGVATKEVV